MGKETDETDWPWGDIIEAGYRYKGSSLYHLLAITMYAIIIIKKVFF